MQKFVLAFGITAALALGACGGAGAPVAATAAPTTAAPTAAATTATSPSAAVTVKGTIVFEVSSSRTKLTDERPGGSVKSRTDLKVGMLVTVTGPAGGGEATAFTVTG
jgi:hypothetical protein